MEDVNTDRENKKRTFLINPSERIQNYLYCLVSWDSYKLWSLFNEYKSLK